MQKLTATYSLEDNKLRMYATERLEPDLYARVKSAGFIWAPKQELFVAPMWTPSREALLIELCNEIENEDSTLEQRAADRAERFESYSSKRGADANRAADAAEKLAGVVPFGQPILIGHHSQRKAEKLAAKITNTMKQAVKFYEQSGYWSTRAEGVLSNAASKSNVKTRINRIKGLEADQRKQEKEIKECNEKINIINTRLDSVMKYKDGTVLTDLERQELVFGIMRNNVKLTDAEYEQYKLTKYDWGVSYPALIRAGYPVEQLKTKALKACENTINWCQLWVDHYKMRIAYEKEMLKASGHEMPDFKAIGKARAAATTSKPIVNTPDLPEVVIFTKAEIAAKKQHYFESYVRPSKCGTYRMRMINGLHCGKTGNDRHKSYPLFISDQKRVEIPTVQAVGA